MPIHFYRFNAIINTVARTAEMTYRHRVALLKFVIVAALIARMPIFVSSAPFKNISVSSSLCVMSPISHVWLGNITIPFARYQVVLLRRSRNKTPR